MTTTKLGQQHIYGTHEARIFALDDGTLRVSLFDGERRLKSWPSSAAGGRALVI